MKFTFVTDLNKLTVDNRWWWWWWNVNIITECWDQLDIPWLRGTLAKYQYTHLFNQTQKNPQQDSTQTHTFFGDYTLEIVLLRPDCIREIRTIHWNGNFVVDFFEQYINDNNLTSTPLNREILTAIIFRENWGFQIWSTERIRTL